MIGVMAIIVILAAALFPAVIRQVDRAAFTKEVNDLSAISNALVLQLLKSKTGFDETTWAAAAANWTQHPVTNITTTPRGYSRAFLLDTNGWLGGFPAGSPYTQTTNGTSCPTGARVLIVSTIATALPVSSGRPGNVAFNGVWNSPARAKPSTWTTWKGSGDDLVIQRLNLTPLFCQLILNNKDTTGAAMFTIDTNMAALPVPATPTNAPWNSYYLAGTVLGLNSNTVIQTRQLLTGNASFVFENGSWIAQIMNGPATTNLSTTINYAKCAGNFCNAPLNRYTHSGCSQPAVLCAMANFMLDYTFCTCNGNLNQQPMAALMSFEAGNIGSYCGSGNGGLLCGY
jgi:type II secretory pathway pseudopilin PulG